MKCMRWLMLKDEFHRRGGTMIIIHYILFFVAGIIVGSYLSK